MILIFESHPIQYRSPLYREASRLLPPNFLRVIYGSDFSVRAYADREFGQEVAWKSDLLSGIDHRFTHSMRRIELDRWRALGRVGVEEAFDEAGSVEAVLLTSLRFEFDWAALRAARRRGIPVLLRTETQDEAFERSKVKQFLRDALYWWLYRKVDQVLPIGVLNACHYARFGQCAEERHFIRYAVPDPIASLSDEEKSARRLAWRRQHEVSADAWVVGFSGKLIEKKNPRLCFEALLAAQRAMDGREVAMVMVGAGPLQPELEARARELPFPVRFTGFLDQAAISDAYLALDVLMLPSRRMGETWGLVVNEALQAGCGVVVTDAVGSHAEFGTWERVRVVPEGAVSSAGEALVALSRFSRSWDWCEEPMRAYSIETNGRKLADCVHAVLAR